MKIYDANIFPFIYRGFSAKLTNSHNSLANDINCGITHANRFILVRSSCLPLNVRGCVHIRMRITHVEFSSPFLSPIFSLFIFFANYIVNTNCNIIYWNKIDSM